MPQRILWVSHYKLTKGCHSNLWPESLNSIQNIVMPNLYVFNLPKKKFHCSTHNCRIEKLKLVLLGNKLLKTLCSTLNNRLYNVFAFFVCFSVGYGSSSRN